MSRDVTHPDVVSLDEVLQALRVPAEDVLDEMLDLCVLRGGDAEEEKLLFMVLLHD